MATLRARALMHPGTFTDLNLQAIANDLDALNGIGADYYVGGPYATDNTIQGAIDRAQPGDRIWVWPGTYTENLVIDKDDISILAAVPIGRGVTTNFRPVISGGANPALTLAQCYRPHTSGLYLYSTGAVGVLTDAEGWWASNCEFDADGGAAVKFHAATTPGFTGSGSSLIACIFDGSENGIKHFGCDVAVMGEIVQATNVVVRDCQFYGNSGADIADDGKISYNYWDAWLIENCKFQDVNKATYLEMDAAGVSGGGIGVTSKAMIAGCDFASDGPADTTIYKLSTGLRMVNCRDSNGIIDASAL